MKLQFSSQPSDHFWVLLPGRGNLKRNVGNYYSKSKDLGCKVFKRRVPSSCCLECFNPTSLGVLTFPEATGKSPIGF